MYDTFFVDKVANIYSFLILYSMRIYNYGT